MGNFLKNSLVKTQFCWMSYLKPVKIDISIKFADFLRIWTIWKYEDFYMFLTYMDTTFCILTYVNSSTYRIQMGTLLFIFILLLGLANFIWEVLFLKDYIRRSRWLWHIGGDGFSLVSTPPIISSLFNYVSLFLLYSTDCVINGKPL